MTIILFGDSHLDLHKWADRPTLAGDSFCSFRQIVDLSIAKEASAVIAAGDLIDIRLPGSGVVMFVREQLQRLNKHGIQFCYIQGQHDYADPPWLSSIDQNTIHMDKKLIEIEGIRFYGLDWRRSNELAEDLKNIPSKTQILVAHQVWSEFMGEGRSEGSWDQIPEHVKVLFTGDFHETHVLKTERGLRVISPGSTNLRKVNENTDKFVFILTRKNRQWRWHKHKLQTRRKLKRTVMSADDLRHFKATIGGALDKLAVELADEGYPEEIRKPILYVKYDATLDCIGDIMEAVGDKAHLFESPQKYNKRELETEELRFRDELVRKGVDAVLERITNFSDDLRTLAKRLMLAGSDYVDELLAIRRENGIEDVTLDSLGIASEIGAKTRQERNTVIAEHSRRYTKLEQMKALYLLEDESMAGYCSRMRKTKHRKEIKFDEDEEDQDIIDILPDE